MPQPALDTHAEVRKLKQAGCQEEQAEAMVDLVGRAPLNAQIAGSLEQVQFRLDSIESNMATQSALEALALRTESIESSMAGMATQSALEALALRTESIESSMAGMATQSALEALALRVESIESRMAGMATQSDLNVLGAETKAAIKDLRSEMFRMIWIQGAALATLILGLALS